MKPLPCLLQTKREQRVVGWVEQVPYELLEVLAAQPLALRSARGMMSASIIAVGN
jgi:hypothetical protein